MRTIRNRTLTIATYSGFAPVCAISNRRIWGTDIAFLLDFAAALSLKADIQFRPFNGIWMRPGMDECDVAGAGIAPLPSRASEGVKWSDPYYGVQRSLLVRKEDAGKELQQLAGRKIAVTQGSTAEQDTRERMQGVKPPIEVVFYDHQEKAVQDLLAGKIDAFGEGDVSNDYLALQDPARLAVTDQHPMSPPEVFAFAVREDSGILVALNDFIAANKHRYLDIDELALPEAVKERERAWATAAVAADVKALDEMLADGLVYSHADGRTDNKASYLDAITSGRQKYEKVEYTDLQARTLGTTAAVVARANFRSTTGGHMTDMRFAILRVYTRVSGKWQMLYHQSSRVPMP